VTHRNRLAAPRHYPVSRKDTSYVHDMKGSRSPENAVPVSVVLRDMLEYVDTESEAKKAVKHDRVLRNGEPLSHIKQGVGVLDVVSFPGAERSFRMLRKENRLELTEVEDNRQLAKIVSKKDAGDRYVYGLHTGENHSSGDSFETGTTLVFENGKLDDTHDLDSGAHVVAIDGGHAGRTGEVESVEENGRQPDEISVSGMNGDFKTQTDNIVALGGVDL